MANFIENSKEIQKYIWTQQATDHVIITKYQFTEPVEINLASYVLLK